MSTLTWTFPNDTITSKVNATSEIFNITEKLSNSWSKLTSSNSEKIIPTFNQSDFLSGWNGTITSGYGTRTFRGKEEFHRGIDIAIPSGTSLESNVTGKVVASGDAVSQGYDDSYGNLVVIQDSYGREHLFGHLEKATTKVGEQISVGEQIGIIGSTGNSTGSHLHYEIMYEGMAIDPASFVAHAKNGVFNMFAFNSKVEETQQIESVVEASEGGMFAGITDFMDFVNTARKEGLSIAIWGKPFDQVVIDGIGAFFGAIFKGIGIFITQNSDLFFLAPALLFLFLTFMVGRNRFTKWIIPLTLFYVCSKALYYFLIDQ